MDFHRGQITYFLCHLPPEIVMLRNMPSCSKKEVASKHWQTSASLYILYTSQFQIEKFKPLSKMDFSVDNTSFKV